MGPVFRFETSDAQPFDVDLNLLKKLQEREEVYECESSSVIEEYLIVKSDMVRTTASKCFYATTIITTSTSLRMTQLSISLKRGVATNSKWSTSSSSSYSIRKLSINNPKSSSVLCTIS